MPPSENLSKRLPFENTVAEQVREFLRNRQPLKEFTLADVYSALCVTTRAMQGTVRAALYSMCIGKKVSERGLDTEIYAFSISGSTPTKFRPLPGIPRRYLLDDQSQRQIVEGIKRKLESCYPRPVIDYWLGSAQKRSVDQAAPAMRHSRRNGVCLMCSNSVVHASHIVSRNLVFWGCVEQLFDKGIDLFSSKGTSELKALLRENKLHSDPRFIFPLCKAHNTEMLANLRDALAAPPLAERMK